jgi:peptide/nickel transport system permease protein
LSGYLLKRGATYFLVLMVALSLNFFLPRAMPGNPIEELSESPVRVDSGTIEHLRSYYGLDRPIWTQFLSYIEGLARGDLGYSIGYRTPVASLLLARLPWTLFLSIGALLLSFSAALLLGARSALRSGNDWRVLVPAIALESMPPFVLGSLLLILVGVKLPLFPLSGAYSAFAGHAGAGRLLDLLRHAALPVLVFAASNFFSAYLVVRGSVLLAKNEPYVLMAEMKGLSERRVRYRYVLRNALLPIVTYFGMRSASSAGRAILVEVLFAYPGIGRLSYEAVLSHDFPLLQGAFLTFTLWILLINLGTDCLYASLDPRVREV